MTLIGVTYPFGPPMTVSDDMILAGLDGNFDVH